MGANTDTTAIQEVTVVAVTVTVMDAVSAVAVNVSKLNAAVAPALIMDVSAVLLTRPTAAPVVLSTVMTVPTTDRVRAYSSPITIPENVRTATPAADRAGAPVETGTAPNGVAAAIVPPPETRAPVWKKAARWYMRVEENHIILNPQLSCVGSTII